MKLPPRNTCASVHQRLKNVAERSGERFNDLLQHYALERFLCRLAASPHRSRFVLKGARDLRTNGVRFGFVSRPSHPTQRNS